MNYEHLNKNKDTPSMNILLRHGHKTNGMGPFSIIPSISHLTKLKDFGYLKIFQQHGLHTAE